MKVLFVCLGNICRSPTAEGVLEHMVTQAQLSKDIQVDSAGTAGYHIGAKADIRSREHAKKRGVELKSRARQFSTEDFQEFDLIITMDDSNYYNVLSMTSSPDQEEKIHKFMDFCPAYQQKFSEVPDPYYDGDQGFETVLDIIEEGCENLLVQLRERV